jgi:hypothetical protein
MLPVELKAVAAVVAAAPRSPDDVAITPKEDRREGPVIGDRPLSKSIVDELKALPKPKLAADQQPAEKDSR